MKGRARKAPAGCTDRRARAQAREVETPAPRVVSIEVPRTDRRTPFVAVDVAVGPLTVALGVVLTRSGWLAVRPPLSIMGKPAVTGPPGLWEEVERLAIATVQRDPAAQRHLTEHRARRYRINSGVPQRPPPFQREGGTP